MNELNLARATIFLAFYEEMIENFKFQNLRLKTCSCIQQLRCFLTEKPFRADLKITKYFAVDE